MIEFTESGGTGHTWSLKLAADCGVELVEHSYTPHCEATEEDDQRPGCVNTHRFVLKAVKKGRFYIDALYRRAWEDYGTQQKSRQNKSRQYEITIL